MQRITLNGDWDFRKVGENEWLVGKVPGSVYNDLLQHKKMEDPFYRDNEDAVKKLSEFDYEYKRSFQVDSSFLENDSQLLIFEGVDTLSKIFINDTLVNETNNMHRRYELDVKGIVQEGENDIKVVLLSPLQYVEKKHNENPIWGVTDAVEGFPHLRKGHSMFGWDWGPQLPDLGIWRNVSLEGYSKAKLQDVYVTQKHDDHVVELSVAIEKVQFSTDTTTVFTKVYDPDGNLLEESANTSENNNIHETFTIPNPQKWYPAQYGEQPLYLVEVEVVVNGKKVDTKSLQIGLRTIDIVQEDDEWGQSFYFKINGTPIFSKGANYIPEDNILARTSREKTERLIKDCVAANFNMIRVWGGGHYPEDYFFELCDQHGLIVWQDFMFACAVYDLSEEFEATVKQEFIDNIKRIRHHASLGIWCGNNEMESAWVDWDFPKTEKHKLDYLKLFEEIIPEIVKEYDPQTFYWPSSPSSGGGFDKPSDENIGDVHYWDVWHGLKPFTEYRKFYYRFVSEFGFQSFPSLKTIKSFTLPEDRNIFSYVMEKHQKNGTANGKILYYLSENFKYPKDFHSLLYTSQILQAEAIKYGVEHWRRNFGRCMGAIYWQLNDCWPVASWASIDYYGRWKALHYFAKRFFSMTLISAKESATGAEIVVTNDYEKAFRGKVKWALRTNSSEVVKQGEEEVIVDGVCAKSIVHLDFSKELKEVNRKSYLEYQLIDEHGSNISNGTVLFVPAKHFEFLNPELDLHVEDKNDRFILSVSAKAYAKYVEIDHQELDFILSDNYFDISAGEEVKVELIKEPSLSNISKEHLLNGLTIRSLYNTY
ncbi:beta-mannosidase [Evansella cellulosilytica]|uniref:Beta-mannosidase B n=1 Tax=Evansella cellulosilytica (strain ATCC 21833 / DSM 2522 / FERM P-1141 / JCM 9156 / N-4) TaxID=649639 RepID=E6TUY5_EVAC2|nr:glycoside hydrolase family 2 protein [Evansella cellulosilytica]ADU28568.1 glycoside hydrolase family 2 sugar binding protein [Evansella cellulosilytica DSM 2522]